SEDLAGANVERDALDGFDLTEVADEAGHRDGDGDPPAGGGRFLLQRVLLHVQTSCHAAVRSSASRLRSLASSCRSSSGQPASTFSNIWWRATRSLPRICRPAAVGASITARASLGSALRSARPCASSCRTCRLTVEGSRLIVWASSDSRRGPCLAMQPSTQWHPRSSVTPVSAEM